VQRELIRNDGEETREEAIMAFPRETINMMNRRRIHKDDRHETHE